MKVDGKGRRPRYLPDAMLRLDARNEFWSGSAIWQRARGIWVCTFADPPLQWMMRKPLPAVKLELLRMGCQWEWVKP